MANHHSGCDTPSVPQRATPRSSVLGEHQRAAAGAGERTSCPTQARRSVVAAPTDRDRPDQSVRRFRARTAHRASRPRPSRWAEPKSYQSRYRRPAGGRRLPGGTRARAGGWPVAIFLTCSTCGSVLSQGVLWGVGCCVRSVSFAALSATTVFEHHVGELSAGDRPSCVQVNGLITDNQS